MATAHPQSALDRRGGLNVYPLTLMTITTINMPRVPGGCSGEATDDSRQNLPAPLRLDNLQATAPNCQTTLANLKDFETLNVITFNTRTLRTEERLIELENALENIQWDIVGLSEVRRDGEETLERRNNIFYYVGGTGSKYGVGFLVAKKWKNNIVEFISYSDRIAVLKFQVAKTKIITLIQVYAPTSSHPNEEVEDFYDLLNKACDDQRGTWTLVIGDFNAKIGKRLQFDNQNIIGPHGLGIRNERGDRVLQFAFGQNLHISNSYYFKKPSRRWTWQSPDHVTKNEIDFCLSTNKQIIRNVETIKSLAFSSDHRPLRIKVSLNFKVLRNQMIKNSIKALDKTAILAHQDLFSLELQNSFNLLNTETIDDIETQYNNIKDCIRKATLKIKVTKTKQRKLSQHSKKLIEERQKLTYHTTEYTKKDKEVKNSIRKDIREYNNSLVKTTLENSLSLKKAKTVMSKGRSTIASLKDSTGVKRGDRDKIIQICTDFYSSLYFDDLALQISHNTYMRSEDTTSITPMEVHRAIKSMKYNRSPGDDGITTEHLKLGEPVLNQHITKLFNSILDSGLLPKNFCHSNIILLHKKGDKSDIQNYRPISLISHLYKAFIKVIENRISSTLDTHQPPEQAGFRRGLSTTDHLHSINQILEKHVEFKLPLYLAFVDYSKAFDSITHSSIFAALHNQTINDTYIQLLTSIYRNSTASIKLNHPGPSFRILKGVKQGDPLSPKLFNAVLEEVFKKLADGWEECKGIVVGEKRLSNLRFADDIVLFSSSAFELRDMLEDLSKASLEVGLRMNMSKTKLMTNSVQHKIHVGGGEVAYVQEYIYLGQIVSFQARQDKEVARRTENAWRSFWSMKDLLKGTLPMSLKRKLMDMCILPILTYGAQTWSLTCQQRSALEICQRAMERSILGVKLIDHIRNITLRSNTKIADVTQKTAFLKWDWAGHVCRMPDKHWAKITTEWAPTTKRPRGRPRKRWRDDIDSHAEGWKSIALDRDSWREGREAFALQWDPVGS